MATENLTWRAAVEITCCELEEFAAHRDARRTVAEAALAMGIEAATATQYERTLRNLLAVLTKDLTTPSPARPEVAPQQALNNHEGVTAP